MNPGYALRNIAALLTAIFVLSCATAQAQGIAPPYAAAPLNPVVHRVHQAYYAMQHNTYEHGATLTGWYNQGFRAIELDVVDVGDWELDANGPYVSHDSNVGDRNCSGNPDRIGHCLRDTLTWLDANPGQGPIVVFVDMKPAGGVSTAFDWDSSEVRLLDDKIRQILGTRMYTGDELYLAATGLPWAPGRTSLRQAVSTAGWPLLASVSNRVIVAYTGGRVLATNQTHGGGIEYIVNTTGRLPYGFFCPDVESTPHQIVPGGTVDGVSNATSQFFVCSNIKARDHYQIAANASHTHKQLMHLWNSHVYANDSYTFNYIAVAHGASAIGRDGNVGDTWGGLIPLTGVRRSLPGYFELRPTYATGKCMDVNGSGSGNGTRIQLYDCTGGNNQRFVYTAEGQLRPRHANTMCTDISGGSAGNLVNMHLWDCDGGASEKWAVGTDGRFRSVHNNQQYCMSVQSSGTANGTRFVTYACGNTLHPQLFRLVPVADWPQTSF
jgi:hypothetical protein